MENRNDVFILVFCLRLIAVVMYNGCTVNFDLYEDGSPLSIFISLMCGLIT